MNTPYHLRRTEKALDDEAEQLAVLRAGTYVTVALCKDNEPYLVTMNYAFDEARRCLYFHCARLGKKLDYWAANPVVWGQVLEDRGYLAGKCSYAYRTVQFRGRIELLQDREAKREALRIMIERLEPDPDPVKKKLIEGSKLDNVVVGCIYLEALTGKQSPPPKRAAA